MSVGPVLYKTPQLVLPIQLPVSKCVVVILINLVNNLNGEVYIPTPTITTIVVPIHQYNFLFPACVHCDAF